MTPKERKLAGQLLNAYSEDLSNRGCNDWEYPPDWTEGERQRFAEFYWAWTGDPDAYDPDDTRLQDWMVASYLGARLSSGDR